MARGSCPKRRQGEGHCPSTDEFPAALRSAQRKTEATGDLHAVGKLEKRHAMIWCLAMAVQAKHHQIIKDAQRTCLAQDARAGRLMVRASVSTTAMESHQLSSALAR